MGKTRDRLTGAETVCVKERVWTVSLSGGGTARRITFPPISHFFHALGQDPGTGILRDAEKVALNFL